MKNDNNSPVFVRYNGLFRSETSKFRYKPAIHYMIIYLLFGKLKARLNHKLNKRYWNPYVLRHSKLTEYATSVSDQVLKNYAGWTADSAMTARYIHLSGKDVTPAILAHHGLGKIENKPQETSKLCPRCKHTNQLNNKYCDKCSLALSVEAFEEMKKKEIERENEFQEFKKEMKQYKMLIEDLVLPLAHKGIMGRIENLKNDEED